MCSRPVRKRQGFPVGSRIAEQNALDVRDAERRENLPRGIVFGGKAAARELQIRAVQRLRVDRHSLCHSALDEICGIEDARAIGVDGNDDDIDHFERILRDECRPQRAHHVTAQHRAQVLVQHADDPIHKRGQIATA